MYVINSITKWSIKWIKDEWIRKGKGLCNLDLIQKLYKLTTDNNIRYEHVKGHSKKPCIDKSEKYYKWLGNDIADKLAKRGYNLAII
jgi:ribonuclease HI